MIALRHATTADADAVGKLHLASWRHAYRGIFTDHFLEHVAAVNREGTWRSRLAADHIADIRTRLAYDAGAGVTPEQDGRAAARDANALLGFSCTSRIPDPAWGVLLDNLHVRPDVHGRGIGRTLIGDVAAWTVREHPGLPLHLWVYEANHQARAFYDRLGGVNVEAMTGRASDGGSACCLRYVWRDVAVLLATTGSR